MQARPDVSRTGVVSLGIVSDGFTSNVFNTRIETRRLSKTCRQSLWDPSVPTLCTPPRGCVCRCLQYSGQSSRKNYTGSERLLQQSVRMSAVTNGLPAVESGAFSYRRVCRLVGAVQQAGQQLRHDADSPKSRSGDTHNRRYDADDSGAVECVSGLIDAVSRTEQTPGATCPEPFDGESRLDSRERQSCIETSDELLTGAVQCHRTGETRPELSGGCDRLPTELEQTVTGRRSETENTGDTMTRHATHDQNRRTGERAND